MKICASRSALLFYAPDDGFARSFPHPHLPMDRLAAALVARRAIDWLPVPPDLLHLFSGGGGTSRRVARELARVETSCALPPMGRPGRGSGSGAEQLSAGSRLGL